MDNNLLDEVLMLIEQKRFPFEEDVYHEFRNDIEKQLEVKEAINFLLNRQLLNKLDWGSQKKIELSAEGKKFLVEGGFVTEYKDKKDSLRYSKESRDYARKAYIIAVIGIIVTIILFFISK